MRINSLSLENYRNIIRCDLTPGEGVNLIVGDNAQGKTNLMEAIWLLTGEKTFRYGREHDIPRLDMDRETQRTRVYANVFAEGRDQELEYILWPRRQVKINGITEPGRGAFSGKLCCVIFSPNHLSWCGTAPRNAGISWTAPSVSCGPSISKCSATTTVPWPSAAPCSGRPSGTAAGWICCRYSITMWHGWEA